MNNFSTPGSSSKMTLRRVITSLIPTLIIVFITAYYFWNEKANDYFRFSKVKYEGNVEFSYKDVTSELGINHKTNLYISSDALKNYYAMAPAVDYISIGDIDGDGYSDMIFTTADKQQPLKVYRSLKGKKFESIEDKIGLNLKGTVVYAAALFDYDNDGWLDLYVAREGCHDIYRNVSGKRFESAGDATGVSKICNKRVTGISVLDYNRDGYLDLYFTRLYGDDPKTGGDDGKSYFIPRINKKSPGAGKNFLIENVQAKSFKILPNTGLSNGYLAWAAGVTDINDDGKPDLIVANDFSVNKVYINQGDGTFKDRTRGTLGLQYNSANMSLETGDFDNDGKVDFFVSNVSRSTYAANSYNYLFRKTEAGHYENKSLSLGVDKCGWSWGAKFIDPNHDGRLDLMVANGFFNDGPKPYWYQWSVYGSLPQYLVNSPRVLPDTEGHSIEGDQPNCLFTQMADGSFINVAEKAGIVDTNNGRGLAMVDLENNGSFDLVIANHNASPNVYKQISAPIENNWIGLHLRAREKNIFAIGAKVKLTTSKGTRVYEHYPTNGYASQSQTGIIFGIGKEATATVEVQWPSGTIETYRNLKTNEYNKIEEPRANAIH